jgi:hypothetical protein
VTPRDVLGLLVLAYGAKRVRKLRRIPAVFGVLALVLARVVTGVDDVVTDVDELDA